MSNSKDPPVKESSPAGKPAKGSIAGPMVGGMISSTVLTLAVIPAIYAMVKQWCLKRGVEH